ncbi:hypothetical protein DEO72_LG1g3320 [Vigna unguiculata]|uniref:Uncharacterized protein n=1 Tax=Vigna unguiculata TaxID=3917 RepID=A0A4D6KSY8_VIGUN|nr:hypothetical protein DEO72_LG1g3320 [Vigna unguiculata]
MAKSHQNHLHQHHLPTSTTYTIITKLKQIGTCRKPCYGSYIVTPGGVPKYEHSSLRSKTTKLVSQLLRRAIYLDPSVLATTSTLTPTSLANPSQNSRVPRVHPPSRAPTQEMLFRATTQGIPRTPATPPLEHHQKSCRSRIQNQPPEDTVAKSPSGGHVPLRTTHFQTALRGTRTAKRQAPQNHSKLQAPLAQTLLFQGYRLEVPISPPGATPVPHALHNFKHSEQLTTQT